MHLAHSALQDTIKQISPVNTMEEEHLNIRFRAYQAVCNKYNREIAAIQKYIPGWVPVFSGR